MVHQCYIPSNHCALLLKQQYVLSQQQYVAPSFLLCASFNLLLLLCARSAGRETPAEFVVGC